MILLLLMGLGAASVKAQVRIGRNAAPNASAVLDLNADDTNSGTKGLALPRVALTSNQMLLPGVTANLTGMMVYNTSTTGTGVNSVGIYVWTGATWNRANLPSTSAADSGKVLISNGVSWVVNYPLTFTSFTDTVLAASESTPITWTKVLGWNGYVTIKAFSALRIQAPAILGSELCNASTGWNTHTLVGPGTIYLFPASPLTKNVSGPIDVRCFRPSA